MASGLILIIATGIVWVAIGIILSRIASSNASIIAFYSIGCWVAAILSWIILADWDLLLTRMPSRSFELAQILLVAGILNSLGQMSLINAMKNGHRGISWAIVQMAMLIPFICAIILWGEQLTISGISGTVLFLMAITCMASNKNDDKDLKDRTNILKWIFFVICAMLMIGSSQTFQAVSSHWEKWSDEANLRVPLLLSAGALTNTFWLISFKKKITLPAIRYGCLWGAMAILSYILLFSALDRLAENNLSGLAFPLAQATCMAGFALYSIFILREKFKPLNRLGLCLALIGIIVFTMR